MTDPAGVLREIIAAAEPGLDTVCIDAAIADVSPHRHSLRKLAQALEQDPGLLTSGRPAGPASIQKLIRALLSRGAVRVSPPRCARCGGAKPLRALDGALRICAWCDMQLRGARKPCAICGKAQPVAYRDRDGKPRCARCRPGEDTDPAAQLVGRLAALGTGLSRADLESAVRTVAPLPAQQQRLAWDLQDDPALLSGGAATGSAALVRLVGSLLERGARNVVMPPCPFCGGTARPLNHVRDGLRCCRQCWERPRMESCSRCGTDKAVAERAPDGSPLCLGCSRNDPVNHGTCAECGRRARIVATVSGQPRCRRCRRLPEGICTLCGQRKPCHFAGTGRARCEACSRRLLSSEPCSGCGNTKMVWARLPDRSPLCVTCTKQRNQQECSGCGFVRPVTGRAPDGGALCRSCYAAHPVSFQECGQCGTLERLYHHGLCSTCAYHACLRDLLSGPDGSMRPAAEEVFVVLAGMNPVSAMAGLHGRAPGRLLAAIGQAAGPVTHEFLDGLQPQRGVQYLRARLVDAGVLPARDEQLIALQRWIDTVLGEVPDAGERAVLRRFLTWTYLRRLRGQGQMTTSVQAGGVRHQVRQVLSLLAWLRSRGRSLQTATQNDIDEWLADGPRIRREARVFAAWAARRGHSGGFEIPALPQENLRGTLMAETHRRSVLFRLLHDTSLDTSDRVAGLLVLLFALPLTRIAALEAAHVRHENGTTVLVLSEEPIVLPPPLDVLLRDLAAERASAGSRWLFPGGPAGQPISVGQLGRRVQRLGIRARPAHNATMMKIAADMPASVVGKFIGLHPTTAARWAGQAGAPRSAYAATLARRAARQAGNARPGYAAEVSRRNRR